MYTVNNKFEIGEECFTIYRKPIHYECPICKGNGKFLYNGYNIWCENCNGSGKLHNPKQSVLDVCKVKIRKIVASIGTNETSIRYKVNVVGDLYLKANSRSENNLFKSAEEAEKYCVQANTKQIKAEF